MKRGLGLGNMTMLDMTKLMFQACACFKQNISLIHSTPVWFTDILVYFIVVLQLEKLKIDRLHSTPTRITYLYETFWCELRYFHMYNSWIWFWERQPISLFSIKHVHINRWIWLTPIWPFLFLSSSSSVSSVFFFTIYVFISTILLSFRTRETKKNTHLRVKWI